MDPSARARISEYVRPLAAGLDGVTNYGDIERIVVATERIAEADSRELDRGLLFLLAVFSGQEKWVSRMGHKSRTEIFLSSLDVSQKTVRALFRGLVRFEKAPATPEEEIVHDALRLDAMGAYGVARGLIEGHRERMDFLEMAEEIERAAGAPLKTEAGRALAEKRRAVMRDFAQRLREEYREFARSRSD